MCHIRCACILVLRIVMVFLVLRIAALPPKSVMNVECTFQCVVSCALETTFIWIDDRAFIYVYKYWEYIKNNLICVSSKQSKESVSTANWRIHDKEKNKRERDRKKRTSGRKASTNNAQEKWKKKNKNKFTNHTRFEKLFLIKTNWCENPFSFSV